MEFVLIVCGEIFWSTWS